MQIEVLEEPSFSDRAADDVVEALAEALSRSGRAVWCASAGRTPLGAYGVLRTRHRSSLDWTKVHLVQMDEYFGMAPSHPQSFAHFLSRELVEPLQIGSAALMLDADGMPRETLEG